MLSVRIFFSVICFAFISGNRVADRHLLAGDIVEIAEKEVGVQEASGRNDGPRVEEYLHSVGLHRGDPWCAAWVSWVYREAGYPGPRTGWSPDLFPSKRLVKIPEPGDVFGIYIPTQGRIAHCGIVQRVHHDLVYSVEGNTNNSGGREGDGVYRRIRPKLGIRKYANWRNGRREQS
jgi:hypothetical protein